MELGEEKRKKMEVATTERERSEEKRLRELLAEAEVREDQNLSFQSRFPKFYCELFLGESNVISTRRHWMHQRKMQFFNANSESSIFKDKVWRRMKVNLTFIFGQCSAAQK